MYILVIEISYLLVTLERVILIETWLDKLADYRFEEWIRSENENILNVDNYFNKPSCEGEE